MSRSLLLGLVLLLAACSSGGDDEGGTLSAADQARAQALLTEYQQARRDGSWEVAEARGQELRQRFPGSAAADAVAATLPQAVVEAGKLREARQLRDLWDYQAVSVPGGVQRTASIASHVSRVEEDEPAPPSDAQLVLRDHPSWGRSAYLLLAQKKFDCGSPCTMTIIFDDGDGQSYAGKQADSGHGPALFIVDRDRFVAALESAKRVRIVLPKGSGLLSSVSFDVGGYQAARFAKP